MVTGARQVGKTTLVQQMTDDLRRPVRFVSADEPTLRDAAWLRQQWDAARLDVQSDGGVLVVDEVQKIEHGSETVKHLWDEDTRKARPLRVVLLGLAPLLIERGLAESLAGRFETLHLPHGSWTEMREVFGFSLEAYLYFGGYPGAAPLAAEPVQRVPAPCAAGFGPSSAGPGRSDAGGVRRRDAGSRPLARRNRRRRQDDEREAA